MVRKAREESGKSQQELAQALELTRTTISNIELGKQQILAYALFRLSKELSVPVESFFPKDSAKFPKRLVDRLPENLDPKVRDEIRRVLSKK